MALNEIPSKTHSSTKSQFSLHFVKTGIFDKEYGRLFSELLDWRQKGDYDNIFDYDKYSVEPLFEPIEKMIKLIEQEIQNKLQQH